jgi:hypothetical protein
MIGQNNNNEDFSAMVNLVAAANGASSFSYTLAEIQDIFAQLNELLANTRLDEGSQIIIREFIELGQQIQHPEALNTDVFGLEINNLFRMVDEVSPNVEELNATLTELFAEFNRVITPEIQADLIMMAVVDIHYNDTYSIFSNLFEPKQSSETDYLGKLEMDIIKITDYM